MSPRHRAECQCVNRTPNPPAGMLLSREDKTGCDHAETPAINVASTPHRRVGSVSAA